MSKRRVFKMKCSVFQCCKHERCGCYCRKMKGVFLVFFFRGFFFNKGTVQSTGVWFYFNEHFGISCQTSADNNLRGSTPDFLSSSFKERFPFCCSPQTHIVTEHFRISFPHGQSRLIPARPRAVFVERLVLRQSRQRHVLKLCGDSCVESSHAESSWESQEQTRSPDIHSSNY